MPLKPAQRARKLRGAAITGVVVGVIFAAATAYRFFEISEWSSYDARVRATAGGGGNDSSVVVIDITELDMQNVEELLGYSWPWPRVLHGEIANFAIKNGAKAVMIDLLFMDRSAVVADLEEFGSMLAENKRTAIGIGTSEEDLAEGRSEGDRYVLPAGRYATRAEALRVAAQFLAWDTRVFVTAGERPTVYYGGKASPDQLAEVTARLAEQDALKALLAPPEGAPAPEPRKLDAELARAELTGKSLVRERFELAIDVSQAQAVPEQAPLQLFPLVAALAPAAGAVSQLADGDGVFRRIAYFFRDKDRLLPSLVMAAYRIEHPDVEPVFSEHELRLGDTRVPLDDQGKAILRYHDEARYQHFMAWDVLSSIQQIEEGKKPTVAPDAFRDKYVILSPQAAALRDIRPTPLGSLWRGGDINALALDNLLEGAFVRRTGKLFDAVVTFFMCLAGALAIALILNAVRSPTVGFALATGAGVFLMGGYGAITYIALARSALWMPLFVPLLGTGVTIGATVLLTSVIERRDRRFVQEALGRYTAKSVVDELMAHPEKLSLEWGEKREMSVYFSDIAGFTTISEGLDPKQLVALLNDYLTSMTEIVLAHGGVIDKYIGDAIMAFWGAPVENATHARDAVDSALEMVRKNAELRDSWKERFGHDVYARAGVNTGIAVVGNMGSKHKYNYTVMGDMVNLASRLEGANKAYGSTLMISETTYRQVEKDFEVRELDYLAVKGKNVPVRVYEVLARKGELDATALAPIEEFTRALEMYRARQFDRALAALQRTLELKPNDGPAEVYVERCQVLIDSPPGDEWDGVWHMKEK